MMATDGAVQNSSTSVLNKPSKPRNRFARSSTKILKQWYKSHLSYPYPTDEEKKLLQIRTGLHSGQISTWFANARRRDYFKSSENNLTLASDAHSITSISVPNLPGNERGQELSPFDRWRDSPPEQEAASWSDISRAVAQTDFDPSNQNANGIHQKQCAELYNSLERPYSENSFDALSSANTSNSSNSMSSAYSIDSISSAPNLNAAVAPRHRRCRRPAKHHHQPIQAFDAEEKKRIYQCTFCTDKFTSKYDWTRHENTLHLLLERWTCSPSGPIHHNTSKGSSLCVFCGAVDPNEAHLKSHNYALCASKPPEARSFRRKDHLIQHLRHVHGVNGAPLSISDWKTKITTINCRCGFCGERFTSWTERSDHIADHFRDGTAMKDWSGCRGLDPEIAALVEKAMPPYLIGAETNEFEPFSATLKSTSVEDNQQAAPTKFESLTASLGDYVKEALRNGIVVTDESVRKQARIIMFGDEDAWNQTPADNVEWLRLFKTGLGLDSGVGAVQSVSNVGGSLGCDGSFVKVDGFSQNLLTSKLRTDMGTQFSQYGSFGDAAIAIDHPSSLPLYWQTPECLAELRQRREIHPYSTNQMTGGRQSANSTNLDNFSTAGLQGNSDWPLSSRNLEDYQTFSDTGQPSQLHLASTSGDKDFTGAQTPEPIFPLDLHLNTSEL